MKAALSLNKVSLIQEPTHLRRGDKNGKDYYMDTKLEPIHTGLKKEHCTGKTGLNVWKNVLLGVSYRFPPMLFHTISGQIDHFLERGQLY